MYLLVMLYFCYHSQYSQLRNCIFQANACSLWWVDPRQQVSTPPQLFTHSSQEQNGGQNRKGKSKKTYGSR